MTISPEVLAFIQLVGPYVLGAIGLLLTSIFSGLGLVGKAMWGQHQKRMELMAEALTSLAQGIKNTQDKVEDEHKKIWDALQGLRAELQLANRNTETVKGGLYKLEGALQMQVGRVDTYVERMGRVDSKLDRIFAYIDAPKRATDV